MHTKIAASQSMSDLERGEEEQGTRAGSDVGDRQNTTVEFREKTNLRAISKYSRNRIRSKT